MSIFLLPPGQCVKSIYTFNAVSSLCFVPEGDGYIITGSGRVFFSFFLSRETSNTANRIIYGSSAVSAPIHICSQFILNGFSFMLV